MGYSEPSVQIDTDEPIKNNEQGRVWKASGGKSGFKGSSETVYVEYEPDAPEGEQFVVGVVTVGGVGQKERYGTKERAVERAKERAQGFQNDFSGI